MADIASACFSRAAMRAAAASIRATRAACSSEANVSTGSCAGPLGIDAAVMATVETGFVETGSCAGGGASWVRSFGTAVVSTGEAGVRGAGTAAGSVVCEAGAEGGALGALDTAGAFAAEGAGVAGCFAGVAP